MARSVRRIIKTATAWATQEDYLEYDPLAGLKHTHGNVRERVLTDEELVRFWAATQALAPEARACLRLHLLLGLRFPSESLPARWDEVDLRGQTWTIPGERRKGKIAEGGGRTLVLPLAPAVIEILNELRGITGKSGRVFGRLARRSAVDYWWRLKVRPAVAGVPITMHDLRRTCATRIVQLGFAWTVADAVLGHAVKGTARHYVHAAPLPEMSRALEAWTRRLTELVSGKPQEGADVVPLRRA
jgi:integrase